MGTHGNILTRPVHEVVNTFGYKSVGVISVSVGDIIVIPGCTRILVFQGVGKVRNPVLVGLSLAQPGLGVSITYEFTYILLSKFFKKIFKKLPPKILTSASEFLMMSSESTA